MLYCQRIPDDVSRNRKNKADPKEQSDRFPADGLGPIDCRSEVGFPTPRAAKQTYACKNQHNCEQQLKAGEIEMLSCPPQTEVRRGVCTVCDEPGNYSRYAEGDSRIQPPHARAQAHFGSWI